MRSRRHRLLPSYAVAIALVAGLWISGWALAGTFERGIEEGHVLLRSGDPAGALKVYRELQIDRPGSELVVFAIGCAQFELGKTGAQPDGLEQARQVFGRFDMSDDLEIRERASYNLANTQTLIARKALSSKDRDEAVRVLEECIRGYETVLEQYPDHGPAEHNRDHVRYLLKRMLQEPPSQASQDKNDDNQEGQDQREEQGNTQEQTEQEQDEQRPQSQTTPGEQDTPADEQDAAQRTEPTDSKTQARDRKTVEAILESLEDRDRLEQRERRRGPVDSQPTREWW